MSYIVIPVGTIVLENVTNICRSTYNYTRCTSFNDIIYNFSTVHPYSAYYKHIILLTIDFQIVTPDNSEPVSKYRLNSLKCIGQKSKEGISNFVDINNNFACIYIIQVKNK